MDNSCKVPEVKPITIKRFGTAGLVPTVPTTLDCNLWQKTDLKDGEFAINTVDDKLYIRSGNQIIELTNQSSGGSTGTVTSVGLTMPSAFLVANSPITSSGTLTVTGAGLASQYVRGDGSLANFPASTGGGASQSFYLNGSVSQGTFGGVAFREMDRVPILGAGTDFTINTNGYIQSFITDAGVPNLLEIPAGNWNFETYFSASSGGGSPSFYFELYKWDGATLSLIASNSATPEGITNGTAIDLYVSALAVPQTTLLATDRLAVRIYVNNSGRTITLHTENNHLCQVITTFSTGLNALNGLTAQVQNFAVGTSGTDFAINSVTDTHTFNLPTASALNRGALSSADWSTFNNKVSTGAITSSGLTMATARLLGRSTAGSGAVEEITIGSGLTLSAGTLTAAGSGITIGTTAIASGTVNRILFEGAGNVVQQDSAFVWNNTDKRLILGTEAVADTNSRLVITGSGSGSSTTTFGLKVHNSTGTNNALVIRDDGFIGIGTSTPDNLLTIQGDNVSDASRIAYKRSTVSILELGNANSSNGGVFIRARQLTSVTSSPLHIESTCLNANDTYAVGTSQILMVVQREASAALSNKPYLNLRNGNLNRFTFAPMQTPTGISTANSTCFAWHSGAGSVDQLVTPEVNSMGEMQIRVTTNPTPINFNLRNYFTTTNANQIASAPFLKFSGGYWNGAADVRVNSSIKSVITTTNYRVGIFNDSNEHLSVFNSGNITIGTTTQDANATKTLVINNGTAPTGNVTDSFQQYSADIVAGNAAPHFRTENGSIIKLYQETTGIAAAAFVANTSLIANDTATFGGYTIGQVVAALKAQGLLA